VIVDPVTARYTDALFELASEQGVVAEVLSDVEKIGAEVADEQVAAWLLDARVPPEEKRSKVEQLASSFHPLTRNFVGLLFDKSREPVLAGLGFAFRERWLESQGSVEGIVESARELGSGEIAELRVSIGSKIGKEVLLENRVNPDLVGGVRVFVAGRLIDYSVRGRLSGLRRKMMEASLPSAS
jgi:F-type H+-transporting ATPase subunit delta